MATTFKKNDVVRVNAVIPQGPVQALRMEEDGTVWCRLEWVDAHGVSQQRWFNEDELVAVE
jgi:uncharacterized protein YodC (DUF2158 family)